QIARRQKAFSNADFQLETGFIAQQVQQLTQTVAEGQLEFDRDKITIIVQTDHTDVPQATAIDNPITLHNFGITDAHAEKPTTDTRTSATPVTDLMPKRTQRHKRGWFSRN
ncbi:MAG: YslB family protein, partial [Loigolactobacillus coryniformis]|nr:YslB family protein [Loigolactobacillus coryniformis]